MGVFMETIGIIAEYNPFHNGHLYQINRVKELTGARNIIVAMSGDFVQRGTPAWTDKYLRTQMALSQGVDMVFELPVIFATSSAETFARAGVSLLTSLGFVDGICFGSECSNLSLLQKAASFLLHPSDSFEETIRSLTARGFSYPAARQNALNSLFTESCMEYPDLFSEPNTILALEYLKAIQHQNSPLVPGLIPREGSGYHSTSLKASFASATAIRNAARNPGSLNHIKNAIPAKVYEILKKQENRYPITENNFSDLLYYRLATITEQDRTIPDMTNEILHRIQKMLPSYTSFSDFVLQIKTKQYTYSRISRVLLRILLGISAVPEFSALPESPYVPYARLLGFRREKSSLLRRKTAIPVITKPADGIKDIQNFYGSLPESAKSLFAKDIFCSNLYRQIQNNFLHCDCPNEYYCQPIQYK